jgi:glycosyltransferase involved in cell wall biosynthesis
MASSQPMVSVVMPVYNGSATIGRALNSVFGQTFKDVEVIVVDDGSTDNLAGVLAAFGDHRVQLIRHSSNKGEPAARNTGIRASRGRYIAFLDCDDEWLDDKLRQQIELLESLPVEIAVSATGHYLERKKPARREARPLKSESDWRRAMLGGCHIGPGTCAVFRAGVFEQVGLLNETLRRFADWDWMLRYTARAKIASIAEPLAIVHVGDSRASIEVVDRMMARLQQCHEPVLSSESADHLAIFRSAVQYERASARFHHGRYLQGAAWLTRAIILRPARGLAFYRQLLRRSGDLLLGRFR